MPYDDDDDLFNHEFDFVDDDDDEVKDKAKDEDEPKPRRRAPAPAPRGRGKEKADSGEKADKPASRGPKRATPPRPRRNGGPDAEPKRATPPPASMEPAPVGYLMDDVPDDIVDEPSEIEAEAAVPVPSGPPADHVVHVYEYGALKRTVGRKFTDEEAVSFAEELTRTGKAYGRYAIATPDDEEPAPTFAGAAKG
jgi:hypothetical protein